MTIRQPGDVVGLCPVCRAEIDLLNPDQVPVREDEGMQERIDRIVEANEALILAHANATHSLRDVMLTLGVARQALQEIATTATWAPALDPVSTLEACRRGLGEGQ